MLKILSITLIFLLGFSLTSPVAAGEHPDLQLQVQGGEENDEDNLILKGTIAAGVAAGAFFIGRHIYRGSQARGLYEEAEEYARQGKWERAVDKYEACLDIRSDYRDAREQLEKARYEAGEMLIARGEEAEEEERYADAIAKYQKAQGYNPESMRAQNRLEKLGEDLVDVHYRRGYEYEVQNRWEEAYEEYSKAREYNLEYRDLENRYRRARAKIEGELPFRALLFVIDRTGTGGLERTFVNELQRQLEGKISPDFYLMERAKVQEVMDEQAAALSEERDRELARDLGRALGADEVIIGELLDIRSLLGSLRMDLHLSVLDVESGDKVRDIDYTHSFGRGVAEEEVPDRIEELINSLVEDEF